MFNNLRELILSMPTEAKCREYIAEQRWGKGNVVCPYCSNTKAYVIEGGKRYKCADKTCYQKFSVTVGTVMEASKIPLAKWLTAVYLMTAHKKGISSHQLGRDLSITQKNSWFLIHRIREMMKDKNDTKLDNIVEIDEVYIGGKVGNMSKSKRKALRDSGNVYATKTMVMGMLERGGNLKLLAMPNTNSIMTIQPTVRNHVDKDAVLITDSFPSYVGLEKEYAGHEVVNHSEQEYVRDGVIHTNSIEGAFSLLKRSIMGIYHQVSPKHLHSYCTETMFRYNLRKMNDAARFTYSLSLIEGRLTYKQLIDKSKDIKPAYVPNAYNSDLKGKHRAIVQLQDGIIIAQFDTVKAAGISTGIAAPMIRRVLKGMKHSTHGYQFKYL